MSKHSTMSLPCAAPKFQMWTTSSSSSAAISSTSLSSSTSTSTSTSTSSPSPYAATNLQVPKTMEEVWNDITLAAADLHHHHPSSRGMILQDFFSNDQPPTSVPSPAFSVSPPPPQFPTMLTLSSDPDRFGPLLFQPNHQIQPMSHVSSISAALDAVVPVGNAGSGKKRCPEIDRSCGDRRHKRMIKNRESAARSRARKQAYTNELELEVANLLEENAKLRKLQEQFCQEAAVEYQKRKPLHRTSTAPF